MSLPLAARVVIIALVAALAPASTAPAAVTSEQAVAFLNAQRTANGIPGDLMTDPRLTLGCQQHNRYMAANGKLDHGESQSNPHYTPEGAGQGDYGGFAEVLAYESYTAAGENPWEWAPIHLYLMLHPEQTKAGYDSATYTCMRMGGDREREEGSEVPGPVRFFSYPGPGTTGIYPEEKAFEAPYTPQQLVGIPYLETTGTNILLFSLGTDGLDAASFSITGPAGPVAARMVDGNTENEVGNGSWFTGGGVLIPEKPLAEHTTYEVTVRWRNLAFGDWEREKVLSETEFFVQQFTFTTGSKRIKQRKPVKVRMPPLHLNVLDGPGNRVRLRLTAGDVLLGRSASLAIYRHEKGCGAAFTSAANPCGWRLVGRPKRRGLRLRRSQTFFTKAPSRWQKLTVKARTPKFEVGKVRFRPSLVELTIRGG